uniref:Uncharacterized protein n=1 Tax=Branchiostoma floridae TaxID=7739 RepID=C3Y6E9_BRAFL|eukprot:XP_002607899.1 hypothetical protein BRAFLDRAFT_74852 [Branchiostoma floridae]
MASRWVYMWTTVVLLLVASAMVDGSEDDTKSDKVTSKAWKSHHVNNPQQKRLKEASAHRNRKDKTLEKLFHEVKRNVQGWQTRLGKKATEDNTDYLVRVTSKKYVVCLYLVQICKPEHNASVIRGTTGGLHDGDGFADDDTKFAVLLIAVMN